MKVVFTEVKARVEMFSGERINLIISQSDLELSGDMNICQTREPYTSPFCGILFLNIPLSYFLYLTDSNECNWWF